MGAAPLSSTIDFFLVSDCASRLVRSVQPIEGTRVKGHVPVIMQFFPRASAWKALHIRNPPRMGKEAVVGPRPVPPTYTVPLRWVGRSLQAWRRGDRLGTQECLDKAYGAWADIAERELAQITGEEPAVWGHRGKCPRATWKSILAEKRKLADLGAPSRAAVLCALKGIAAGMLHLGGLADQDGNGGGASADMESARVAGPQDRHLRKDA